jgi:hypothetical protein
MHTVRYSERSPEQFKNFWEIEKKATLGDRVLL